jgi:DNA replication protein DnaC
VFDRGWRVLFELISERYEGASIAITASQPFSDWDQVLPEFPAQTGRRRG